MLEKDIILAKISIIKNCLKTIEKVTHLEDEKLDDVKQDHPSRLG